MIVPAKGSLLIKKVEPESVSKGGILLAPKFRAEKPLGRVIRASSGLEEYEGLLVYYVPFTAVELDKFYLIKPKDIIAYETEDKLKEGEK